MSDPAGTPNPAAGTTGGGEGTPQTGQPQGTAPDNKPDTGAQSFDSSKLSDEEFGKVFEDPRLFQHSRFKSLNERAKEADSLKKQQTEAEEKALAEQGKWKELAEKANAEKAELETKVTRQSQDQSLIIEAQKAGVQDVEAALTLVNRTDVKLDDNGQVIGAAEAIKALVGAKPYLVGNKPPVTVGSPSNPGTQPTGQTADGQPTFKLSEIKDSKFYKENRLAILKAQSEGRIINDTGAQVGAAGGQG